MTGVLLNVNGIEVIYNHVILVLKGVSLQVPEGKVVALLGGNGAGKMTNVALGYADYGYITDSGRIVLDGEARVLRENEDVKEFYLGVGSGDRKSFRDVKSYKRRKRWFS